MAQMKYEKQPYDKSESGAQGYNLFIAIDFSLKMET